MTVLIRGSLVAACATFSTAAHAGAWPTGEGESYQKIAINILDTSDRFGDDLPEFENFEDFTLAYYAEFGLDEKTTLIVQVPYRDLENRSAGVTTSNSGIGDVDLGLKYSISDGPFVVSVQGLAKLPYLYSENAALPLGNGQLDLEGRLLVGRSLGKFGYFGAEIGYRYRAEEPSDEIRYLVEYGFDLTDSLYTRAKLDGILSVGNAADVATANPANPSIPLEFDLGRLEATVGYKFTDRFAFEFTAAPNIYGDNTLQGTTFQFAVVGQF
ncbi:transporter [Erythrobacter rubeus]|uniref:Transporter n=1 Tax=Erythrobacter rubeus TaxID=2760803 RepID=A0ABR8KS04_9SPHN|nr:hypothetical protein [Erythrobacter rubeus]MBD2842729.1 hypothetical protein [Erythrobacter rubeus]